MTLKISIDADAADQRADRFLRKRARKFPAISRSQIYSRIRTGKIRRNGQKFSESTRLEPGDTLEFSIDLSEFSPQNSDQNSQKSPVRPRKIPLKNFQNFILHRDDRRLVFDKPAGIAVQPDRRETTFADRLFSATQHFDLADPSHPSFAPALCYRLDRDTSGVLIAGLRAESLQFLNQKIKNRQVSKTYAAIVVGRPAPTGEIRVPLSKDFDPKFQRGLTRPDPAGKSAHTEFQTLATTTHPKIWEISLLRVQIFTGRMHQIRVHLAQHGHPILGDFVYGTPAANRLFRATVDTVRHLLHARNYEFTDSDDQTRHFEAPLPTDFTQFFPNF